MKQGARARRSGARALRRTTSRKLAILDLGVSFRTREPVSQAARQAAVADASSSSWPRWRFAIVIGVPLGFVAAHADPAA